MKVQDRINNGILKPKNGKQTLVFHKKDPIKEMNEMICAGVCMMVAKERLDKLKGLRGHVKNRVNNFKKWLTDDFAPIVDELGKHDDYYEKIDQCLDDLSYTVGNVCGLTPNDVAKVNKYIDTLKVSNPAYNDK